MAKSLPFVTTQSNKNLQRITQDPRAQQLNDFLDEFGKITPGITAETVRDMDHTLRAKMDAIAQKVRNDAQTGDHGEEADTVRQLPLPDSPTQQSHEIPVKIRLDTMEHMLREIRDSVKNSHNPPDLSGQYQPQAAPLGSALHATERGTVQSRDSRASPQVAQPGPAQLRREPLGPPPPTKGRLGHTAHRSQDIAEPGYEEACPTAYQPGVAQEYYHARHHDRHRHRQTPAPARTDQRQERWLPPHPAHAAPRQQTHRRVDRQARHSRHRDTTRPRHHRTVPVDSYTATSSSTESESESDPASYVRKDDQTSRRIVDQALARQYQPMSQSKGRICDIDTPLVRPHEALPPDMRRRVRDRTGKKNRRDLTFQEYVCGYTRMLLTELDPSSDLYAMITHLSQVAQDTAVTPWPAVRTWTNACLDYIDGTDATWEDSKLFESERSRLVWAQGRSEDLTPIPCPAYNNDTCKAQPSHHEGEMKLLHTCAICYYAAPTSHRVESSSHNAKSCNRRRRNGARDEQEGSYSSKSTGKRYTAQNATSSKKEAVDARPKN